MYYLDISRRTARAAGAARDHSSSGRSARLTKLRSGTGRYSRSARHHVAAYHHAMRRDPDSPRRQTPDTATSFATSGTDPIPECQRSSPARAPVPGVRPAAQPWVPATRLPQAAAGTLRDALADPPLHPAVLLGRPSSCGLAGRPGPSPATVIVPGVRRQRVGRTGKAATTPCKLRLGDGAVVDAALTLLSRSWGIARWTPVAHTVDPTCRVW